MKKITKKILPIKRRNVIIESTEVFVNSKNVFFCFLESMQSRHTINNTVYVCKNGQMIDIVDAAKYLIQLFYKTGCRYHCSRTKIEKMLSIANLIGLKSGGALFPEENVVNPCGTGFPVLANFFFGDILEGAEKEDCQPIRKEIISEGAIFPVVYKMDNPALITQNVYDLLLQIFLKFGNFDAKSLGIICDEFKENITKNDQESGRKIINSDAVKPFFENREFIERYKNNEIFSFILNYGDI